MSRNQPDYFDHDDVVDLKNTISPASEETLLAIAGLVTSPYDYIEVTTYNANEDPTQIVYKTGGSAGALVATLDLTYDVSGNFETVTST